MADPKLTPQQASTQFSMAEFRKLDSFSQVEIANKVYAANPTLFIREALNQKTLLPVISKEVVKKNNILTQQVMSTYRREIKPLIIPTDES